MLWEVLTGDRVTPSHASSLLDAQFKKAGPGRTPWYLFIIAMLMIVCYYWMN
jgi:hypothetical protein